MPASSILRSIRGQNWQICLVIQPQIRALICSRGLSYVLECWLTSLILGSSRREAVIFFVELSQMDCKIFGTRTEATNPPRYQRFGSLFTQIGSHTPGLWQGMRCFTAIVFDVRVKQFAPNITSV